MAGYMSAAIRTFMDFSLIPCLHHRFLCSIARSMSKSIEKRRRVKKRLINRHKQRQIAWESEVRHVAELAWSRAYSKALSALKSSPQAKIALEHSLGLEMKSELDVHFSE